MTPAATDAVSIRGDQHGTSGTITLQAFDINGLMLDNDTAVDIGGPLLSVSAPRIHAVRFFSNTANVAFDDLTFGPLTAVPEPGTLGLLVVGALGVMRSARRRREVPR